MVGPGFPKGYSSRTGMGPRRRPSGLIGRVDKITFNGMHARSGGMAA